MLRITRQTDYGIVLLTRFAALPAGAVRNARDLAEDEGLPAPMVSKILKLLGRTGLLVSHRGATGGYHLARPASEISVAEVVTALEGPIAMTECLSAGAFPCSIEASCPSRPNWQLINQAIAHALEEVHLSDMLPRNPLPPSAPASPTAPQAALEASRLAGGAPRT